MKTNIKVATLLNSIESEIPNHLLAPLQFKEKELYIYRKTGDTLQCYALFRVYICIRFLGRNKTKYQLHACFFNGLSNLFIGLI